jgi:hypothetical protein
MMKLILLILSLQMQAHAIDLKVGDLLLQPLNCFSCSLIEQQTQSPYSHIGVIIAIQEKQVFVAEAFMQVRVQSLQEFARKTQKGERIKIRRPFFVSADFYQTYLERFDGLNYDAKFLWSNFDEKGEKIYCSELVYKLFELTFMQTPRLKPMLFDINPEHWQRYFQGHVPIGELGIAPSDFDDDNLYEHIGFL